MSNIKKRGRPAAASTAKQRGKGGEGIEDSSGSGDGDGARPMEGDEALDNLRAHPQWQQ